MRPSDEPVRLDGAEIAPGRGGRHAENAADLRERQKTILPDQRMKPPPALFDNVQRHSHNGQGPDLYDRCQSYKFLHQPLIET
jgi:hypothetical protein